MNKYQVSSGIQNHIIEAVTFTLGSDLRFIGEGGSIVAIFTTFDWLKLVPAESTVKDETPAQTSTAEVSGE